MTMEQYHFGDVMSDEDSLAHYGIKGMRWGQRKSVGTGSVTGGRSKPKSPVPVIARPGFAIGSKAGKAYNKYRNEKDVSGVSRREARAAIKKENRETQRRIEDFQSSSNRSDQIRTARNNERAAIRKYEDVRAAVKEGKGAGQLGKNAARVALNKAANERYENLTKAESRTTGEQFADAFLGSLFK